MSKNNTKNILSVVGVLLVVGGLFAWPIITDPDKGLVKAWNASDVGCIAGHSVVTGGAQHIHQSLTITVDGVDESIVPNSGIVRSCMAELHVHEGNTIHLESLNPSKKFKLSQFFIVYEKPLVREGYKLEVTVNNEIVSDPANLVLEDGQVIKMTYVSE